MPVNAILFDVDDTLTDWAGGIACAVTAAIVAHPHPDEGLPGRVAASIRERYWKWDDGRVMAREDWRIMLAPEAPWASALPAEPAHAAELALAFRAAVRPQPFDDVQVIPKLARTFALGLLSNNPRAADFLLRFGLMPDFRTITVTGEGQAEKPGRAAFVAAAGALGMPVAEILVVSAALADVEGALAAGLHAAWLDRSGEATTPPLGALYLTSLHELPVLLARPSA